MILNPLQKLKLFSISLAGFLLLALSLNAQVWVNGYTKSDGTVVQGYWRSNPDGDPYNNYSYPGNTNPYTGKVAPGNPDTYLRNYYNRSSQTPQNQNPASIYPSTEQQPNNKGGVEQKDAYNSYGNKGLFEIDQEDYSGAIEDFTKAISIDNSAWQPYFGRGIARTYAGDYPGAIGDFTAVISLNNMSMAKAYCWRGVARHLLGEKDACLDFQKALQLGYDGANDCLKKYCQ